MQIRSHETDVYWRPACHYDNREGSAGEGDKDGTPAASSSEEGCSWVQRVLTAEAAKHRVSRRWICSPLKLTVAKPCNGPWGKYSGPLVYDDLIYAGLNIF
jgi:hypothetical protein